MIDVARAHASRLGGFAGAAIAGALVAGGAAAGPAGANPTQPSSAARAPAGHVGIVISGRGAYCLNWHPGMTGDAVLNAVARVNYRSDGVIVQIDGAPASGSADDTHYWSYWHDSGRRWEYSRIGEGEYTPAAGEVEGWSFDDGARKPPPPARRPQGLYAAVCSDANRAADAASGTAAAGASPRAAAASPGAAAANRGAAAPNPGAAAPDRGGSPAPTLLAAGVVALLLGSGWAAARRRRAR